MPVRDSMLKTAVCIAISLWIRILDTRRTTIVWRLCVLYLCERKNKIDGKEIVDPFGLYRNNLIKPYPTENHGSRF